MSTDEAEREARRNAAMDQGAGQNGGERIRRVERMGSATATTRFVYVKGRNAVFDTHEAVLMRMEVANNILRAYTEFSNINRLLSAGCEVVTDIRYRPDINTTIYRERNDLGAMNRFLNTFDHSRLPTPDPNWARDPLIPALQAHLDWLFGPGTFEGRIARWFIAHAIAKPGKKIRWMPLVIGPQGDGKTTLFTLPMRALGEAHAKTVAATEILGSFTGWVGDSCYLFFDEMYVPQHRLEVLEKLKTIIADDYVRREPKGVDGYNVKNFMVLAGSSNHEDALPITPGDRRFSILHTATLKLPPLDAKKIIMDHAPEFKALHDLLKRDVTPGVLRGWAAAQDLTVFGADGHAPGTAGTTMMIDAGRSQVEDDLEDLIHNRRCFGVTPYAVHSSFVLHWMEKLYGYNRERGKTLKPQKLAVYLKSCGFAEHLARTDEDGTNSFQHKLTFDYTDDLGNEHRIQKVGRIRYSTNNLGSFASVAGKPNWTGEDVSKFFRDQFGNPSNLDSRGLPF
jgi:hypothetical protein